VRQALNFFSETFPMPRCKSVVELATCDLCAARIHSLERSLYIVELETPEGTFWLGSDEGERAVFRNLAAARTALAGAGEVTVTLVHASAFDEMVGLGPRVANRIEVPLSPGENR
jgi:hypothetical protein